MIALMETTKSEALVKLAEKTRPALDPNYVTRQEAARLAAMSVGINWPKTILPEGTALYQSGVDKLKSDRELWSRLPFAKDALPAVAAALAAEDRRDDAMKLDDVRFDPFTGRAYYEKDGKTELVGYDPHSFAQLVAQVPGMKRAPRGATSTLLFLDNDERAGILNARIPAAQQTVTIRTKMAHTGNRVARAVLSERYADVNDLDVAAAIGEALAMDQGIARLDYKPGDSQSRFEVFYPSEIPVETFRVGDIHRIVVQIENSETGEGSLHVRAGLIRAICANMTLAEGSVSIRHVGKKDVRRLEMRNAIRDALSRIEPLLDAITVSARTPLPEEESIGSLVGKIASRFSLPAARAEAWKETFETSYAHSPTLWGVTSAITEAAQKLDFWGAQAEEEKVASKLLAGGWAALKEKKEVSAAA